MSFVPVRHVKRFSKYGATPTVVDGIRFASKRESVYYADLKLRERAGEIRNLTLQPKFPITINGEKVCDVVLDFSFYEENRRRVLDIKGFDTPISRLKRKLVHAVYPGVTVEVCK